MTHFNHKLGNWRQVSCLATPEYLRMEPVKKKGGKVMGKMKNKKTIRKVIVWTCVAFVSMFAFNAYAETQTFTLAGVITMMGPGTLDGSVMGRSIRPGQIQEA